MPELPEVETTRRGIAPHIEGEIIQNLVVRESRLRWPVSEGLVSRIQGQCIKDIYRRGKYLVFTTPVGSFIWHLGMSGSMQIVETGTEPQKHDHIDLVMEKGTILRYNDPRRFGCLLWAGADPNQHSLIASLGCEPLEPGFNGRYLYARSRNRKISVKSFIMDGKVVVGVGNIYASESLYAAGIRPTRAAGRISLARYAVLAEKISQILKQAIRAGGTTLSDFTQADGRPGYFSQVLQVYGREAQPCARCGCLIKNRVIGQRASYYCPVCQT